MEATRETTPELLEVLERLAARARQGMKAVDIGREAGQPVSGRTALYEIAVAAEDALDDARTASNQPTEEHA